MGLAIAKSPGLTEKTSSAASPKVINYSITKWLGHQCRNHPPLFSKGMTQFQVAVLPRPPSPPLPPSPPDPTPPPSHPVGRALWRFGASPGRRLVVALPRRGAVALGPVDAAALAPLQHSSWACGGNVGSPPGEAQRSRGSQTHGGGHVLPGLDSPSLPKLCVSMATRVTRHGNEKGAH